MTFNVLAAGASPLRILKCDLASSEGEAIYRIVRDGLYRTVGVPLADFTYQPTVPVVNMPVDFNATVSGNFTNIATYMWDFGGTKQNTTVATVSHAFASVGNYTVTLKVILTDGTASASATKYVNVIPVIPELSPTAALLILALASATCLTLARKRQPKEH
jgi:PKD repeat protein